MAFLFLFSAALVSFGAPSGAFAQQAAAAAGATVHGSVVDPDDALVPGATVTITPAGGKNPQTTTSKSDGTYTVRGLAPGTYIVTVTAPGFAAYVKEGVKITAGQNLALDTKLVIQEQSQQMTVTADSVNLSVDPENNASSTVISGAALDALSDDPDELSSELSALAGPSAGPNGGQIYIDGFTGGQLPPKSSIREIRINSNPFSAQYDQLGYGRIEVFTKPGTDKFHGSGSFQFNDKFLNTSTPFLGAANSQPDYHTIFGMGSLTGPIRSGMSFTLSGSHRDIASNDISNPTAIYSADGGKTLCPPGYNPACVSVPLLTTLRAIPNPQTRSDVSPRIDIAVGQKNTLTVRYQYEQGSNNNNLGNSIGLASTTSNSTNSESTVQISDTQLISSKIINETRFEYQHTASNSHPTVVGTSVSVAGVFSATIVPTAGATAPINSTPGDHIEVQNYTSIQLAKNFIRLGGRLRTSSQSASSNSGVNGALSYSYLLDPCTDPTITNKPSGCAGVTTPCADTVSSYQCSIPFQFTQTTVANLTVPSRETDVGIYAEDDWKAKNNLTLSYGVRMEAQNYINSTHDFAPRTSIAYGVPRKNGKTTTVLRAGFGIFYNRFSLNQISNIVQNNPANQTDKLYSSPSSACTPSAVTAPGVSGPCTSGTGTSAGRSTIPTAGPGIRSPYIMESAATVEQQVGKYASVTVTYLNARGVHQYLTRYFQDSGNYCGPAPAASGLDQCVESEGIFKQNQLIFSGNVRTPKGITLFGNYSASFANSNLSGITNPFNPATDYGRAGFAVRSRLTFGGSIPLPFRVTASPLIFANSGSPYNVTTGIDENGDSIVNDRPAFANGTSGNCAVASTFTSPPVGAAYTPVPVNYCTGPANVTISMRLGKTIGFGPKTDAGRAGRGGGAGGGGGAAGGFGAIGGGGGMGGRGGGGGGRGGGGGGGGPQGTSSGRKYNLTIAAQAQNLFNEIPYGTPTSTLTSSLFGKPTTLQGMPFASANAVRRITLSANFFF